MCVCRFPFASRSTHFSEAISYESPPCLNVSKSFDFIACEKDVLWLLSRYENAELRHILRFCVFANLDFMFTAYESDIQIRAFGVLSRFAGAMESLNQAACSSRYIMLIITAVCAVLCRNRKFLVWSINMRC